MASVTLSHGIDNSLIRTVEDGMSLSAVVTPAISQILGLGENMEAVVNGTTVPNDQPLYDNDKVSWRAKAGTKGR